MIFSDPKYIAITVPNVAGHSSTLPVAQALQATLEVFGVGGAEDFADGQWVCDFASSTESPYVPVRDSAISAPTVIQLPLPGANCRIRCVVAPSDISKTPLAILALR